MRSCREQITSHLRVTNFPLWFHRWPKVQSFVDQVVLTGKMNWSKILTGSINLSIPVVNFDRAKLTSTAISVPLILVMDRWQLSYVARQLFDFSEHFDDRQGGLDSLRVFEDSHQHSLFGEGLGQFCLTNFEWSQKFWLHSCIYCDLNPCWEARLLHRLRGGWPCKTSQRSKGGRDRPELHAKRVRQSLLVHRPCQKYRVANTSLRWSR